LNESKSTCHNCNSKNVALILWGYPGDMHSIKQELEDRKIVLGGCIVTDHDPQWECNECHHTWGERDE